MSGTETPTRVGTGQSAAGRPIRNVPAAVAAVAAQALLFDAAIETFVGGSPLRWWLSPAALLSAALVAWGWGRRCLRLDGAACTRAAWAAGLAVLLLLVASAWLPDGQADGVRLLAQPTSTLLAVVTAVGIAVAAFGLIRSRTFGRRASFVVAGLALYSVAALALAVARQTSYRAVLHGQSLWTLLPRFLQGAFLGCVVIVPLALVVEVVRAVRRDKNPWRLQEVVALVMTIVMAGSTVITPPKAAPTVAPGKKTEASALAIPSGAGADPATPFTPRLPERVSFEPEQLAAETDRLARRIPLSQSNLAARADQLGPGIDEAFRVLRDEIGYEPYSGVLRGSGGTYAARAGNAVDRALLLATLLKTKGIPVRFAAGRLDADHAARLLDHVFDRPVTGTAGVAANASHAAAPDLIQRLHARAKRDYAVVRSALGGNLPRPDRPSREELIAEVRQHVWVQADVNGAWVDLDTAFPGSKPGMAYAPADRTFDLPPETMCQQVTIRVIAETLTGGGLSKQKVLEARLNVLNLIDNEVFLLHRPSNGGGLVSPTAAGGTDRWTPVLWVDGEEFDGQPVTFGASAGSVGGILGGDEGGAEFVAEWLEIEIALPNDKREVTRRALVDRAGAAWRKSPDRADGLRALARNAGGVKAPQAAHNIWFSAGPHDLASYAAALNQLAHALRRGTGADRELSADSALRLTAFQNFSWLLATDNLVIPSLNDADHRFYADSPRVTILTVGSDPFSESDAVLTQADLRRDRLRGLTRSGDWQGLAERKLWFATLEGALEHEMIAEQSAGAGGDAARVASTSALLGDEGVVVATAANAAEVTGLVESAEIRERLAAALAAGDTVVVPRRALKGGEGGWWTIAAGSGDVTPVLGADLHEAWNYVNVTANRYAYYVTEANPGLDLRVPANMSDKAVEARYQARLAAREARRATENAKKQRGGTEYSILLFTVVITALGFIGFAAWLAVYKLTEHLVIVMTS